MPTDNSPQNVIQRPVLKDPFIWIAVALVATAIGCVVTIFVIVSFNLPETPDDPFEMVFFIARLLQLTLGMLIGFTLTVLGVVLAWFGVTQPLDVTVESDTPAATAKARLVSAGPGALLVVCGTVIIVYCISIKLEVKPEKQSNRRAAEVTIPHLRKPSGPGWS